MSVSKPGRPNASETREGLRKVTFKADPVTWAVLERLVAAARTPGGLASKRSEVIRRAIQDAELSLPPVLESLPTTPPEGSPRKSKKQ